MTPAERERGERTRARQSLVRLRALCAALEVTLEDGDTPPGVDVAEAVVDTAARLACTIARIDAYQRAKEGNGHE